MTALRLEALGVRLLDFYLASSVVLVVTSLALSRIRQPARRLAACGSTVAALWGLAILGVIPSWPRVGPVIASAPIAAPSTSPSPATPVTPIVADEGGPSLTEPATRRPDAGVVPPGSPGESPRPIPVAVGAFLAGSCLSVGWLAIGLWRASLLRRSTREAPAPMQDALAQVVGIGARLPELRLGPASGQPLALGLFRPTILLPEGLAEPAFSSHLHAILAHEWAHIRNRDLWRIAATRALMPLIYAHPAYWWLRHRMRDDQEFLADGVAASSSPGRRLAYADVLLAWAAGPHPGPSFGPGGALALGDRPSQWKRRITMLLDPNFQVEPACAKSWRIGLLGGMMAAALGLSCLTLRPTIVDAAPQAPPVAKAEAGPAEPLPVRYRVTDPDGKPVAGAKVYAMDRSRQKASRVTGDPVLLATTDEAGSFSAPPAIPVRYPAFAVLAPGYGASWFVQASPRPIPNEYRLIPDDLPIEGQVLDAGKKPVAGATVRVVGLAAMLSGSLDVWLSMLSREKAADPARRILATLRDVAILNLFPTATTDREGRFTIRGIGRERVATLLIQGPGIETRVEQVVTRDMAPVSVPEQPRQRLTATITYHPARFQIEAGIGLDVAGTVSDAATGRPIPGAMVRLTSASAGASQYVRTTTDAAGRYRLAGVPPKPPFGNEQELLVQGDEGGPAYAPAVRKLGQLPAGEPVRQDFILKRGIWATGRVLDKATGQPRSADYDYFIPDANRHREEFPEYGTVRVGMWLNQTDPDGRYRIPVLPGVGVLAVHVPGGGYRKTSGTEALRGLAIEEDGSILATPRPFQPDRYESVIAIDPRPGDATIERDILIDRVDDPGIPITVVDPDGKPIAGAMMMTMHLGGTAWSTSPMTWPEFRSGQMSPGQPRGFFFIHGARRLAGAGFVPPDARAPLRIQLEPSGEAIGRVVDDRGKPVAGAALQCTGATLEVDRIRGGWLPEPIRADADGRFRITGMVPGLAYRFGAWQDSAQLGHFEIVTKPGEVRDLGDVALGL